MTPHNLPQHWQWVTLGEILDYEQPTQYIVKDTQYSDKYPTPVLTAGKSFILGYTNEKTGIFENPLPVIIFDDFTTSTKIVNFPFKVKSSAMKILKKSEKANADIRFVFYMMQNLEINNDTHKRYWLNIVSHMKIPLPPLKIQRKIVEILESKLEKIASAKAILESSLKECETYRLSLLNDAFNGNLTPHSKVWQWIRLGDIAEIIGGTTPSTTNPEYWDGECPWITPAEINNDSKIIYQTKRQITQKAVKDKSLRILPIGTILLSSRAPIGKVAIVGSEMYCNQGFKNLVCDEKKIYNLYLFYFLKGKTTFLNSLGRGTTFKEISKSIVEQIEIPLPPLKIQRKIVEILESKLEKIASAKAILESSLKECETYRLSLLESAFKGELK